MTPRTRFLAPLAGLVMGLLSAAFAIAQPVFSVQDLTGDWTGSIQFFDLALADRVGTLPITLSFAPPGARSGAPSGPPSGTGRLGAATVQVTQARAHRDRLEVVGTLDTAPHRNNALAKKHLVVLITRVTPTQLTGEVHLKSNRVFDPRMREGYVVLERTGGR